MIRPAEEQAARKARGDQLVLLPSRRQADRIAAGLRRSLDACAPAGARVTRTYMDTADGRLGAKAMRLCATPEGRMSRVTWESDASTHRVLRLSGKPGLASELPSGPFRNELADVIAERRLLPIARVKEARPGLDIVDARGKTVARVRFEQWSRVDKGRSTAAGPLLLRVSPVRGFRKAFERVLETVHELSEPTSRPAGDPLAMLGLAPAGGKRAVHLTPDLPVAEAARRLLLAELAAIESNEEGTRNATDPEFLHEYRVAVRRTRVVLSRFRGVFPARRVERFKRDFRWLGDVTGPARDTDVYLLELPAYEKCLSQEAAEHLAPLRPYLTARLKSAYATLRRAMDTQRYERLLTDWRTFLETPLAPRTTLNTAKMPVGAFADAAIWRIHKRVLKQGGAINDATPDQAVHDLRLACKKLRYLMEFFRSLYPAATIRRQIKALKQLQGLLGEFNDLSVQQNSLLATANGMADAGVAGLETIVAMGRLVETLGVRQRQARTRFGARFDAFASDKNRKRAHSLFRAEARS